MEHACVIQNAFRNFISKKKLNKNKIFKKIITGFHLINCHSIKETDWETIQENILNEIGDIVLNSSKGNHKSGKDIETKQIKYSNKTCKINNNLLNISSYRLTTVTNPNNINDIENIIDEINKRTNFDKYSILARIECDDKIIYYWIEIPHEYMYFDPKNYEWDKSIGKILRNRNVITGWETNNINNNSMKIVFSMSSQLWIELNFDLLKEYIICRTEVYKSNIGKISLSILCDLYQKMNI